MTSRKRCATCGKVFRCTPTRSTHCRVCQPFLYKIQCVTCGVWCDATLPRRRFCPDCEKLRLRELRRSPAYRDGARRRLELRRKTPEYHGYLKAYRAKNRDRLNAYQRRRYVKKAVTEIVCVDCGARVPCCNRRKLRCGSCSAKIRAARAPLHSKAAEARSRFDSDMDLLVLSGTVTRDQISDILKRFNERERNAG
jgi:hypothetical protein